MFVKSPTLNMKRFKIKMREQIQNTVALKLYHKNRSQICLDLYHFAPLIYRLQQAVTQKTISDSYCHRSVHGFVRTRMQNVYLGLVGNKKKQMIIDIIMITKTKTAGYESFF